VAQLGFMSAFAELALSLQQCDARCAGGWRSARGSKHSPLLRLPRGSHFPATPKVKAVFVKAGIQGEKGSNVEVAWDLADPFAQSLVLRAYLAASGELTDDIRAAQVTHFVLARGPGRLSATSPASLSDGLPSSVVGEIESERGKLLDIAVEDDPVPRCWPVYAQTSKGVASACSTPVPSSGPTFVPGMVLT
jgi:hypothetical protein